MNRSWSYISGFQNDWHLNNFSEQQYYLVSARIVFSVTEENMNGCFCCFLLIWTSKTNKTKNPTKKIFFFSGSLQSKAQADQNTIDWSMGNTWTCSVLPFTTFFPDAKVLNTLGQLNSRSWKWSLFSPCYGQASNKDMYPDVWHWMLAGHSEITWASPLILHRRKVRLKW